MMALKSINGVAALVQDCLQGQGLPRFSSRHEHLASMEARIRTFEDWPAAMPQRPRDMAEAGFFYIGRGDQVKCFYCDIGVKDWTPTASPWEEHVRWSSGCEYLIHNKGKAFVDMIKLRQQTLVLISQQEMRGNIVFLPQWPGITWVVAPFNPQAIQPYFNPPTSQPNFNPSLIQADYYPQMIQPNFNLPVTQPNVNPPAIQPSFNLTATQPNQPNSN